MFLFEIRPVVLVVLQEEFSVQPNDVEVAEGEVAVLNCGPPIGRPEPNVLWKKDGVPVNITDPHFTVSPRGSKANPGSSTKVCCFVFTFFTVL